MASHCSRDPLISACWNYGLFCCQKNSPRLAPGYLPCSLWVWKNTFHRQIQHVSSADTTGQSSCGRVLKAIQGSWAKPAPFITFKIQNISLWIFTLLRKPSTRDLMLWGALVLEPGTDLKGEASVVLRIQRKWLIPETVLPQCWVSCSIFLAI